MLLGHIVYTLTVTLKSDGDGAVDISKVAVSALQGVWTLKSTGGVCSGSAPWSVDVGKTCSVTLTYEPTNVTGADQVTDTLPVDVTSDAAASSDFIENLIILLSDKGN